MEKGKGDVQFAHANDSEYLSAVKNGDMEKAQRMVDEAAKMFVLQRAKNLSRKYGMPVGLRYGELPENNISTGVRPSGRLAQEKDSDSLSVLDR